jgi:endothelin-converting enzyme/putative endopeptidase
MPILETIFERLTPAAKAISKAARGSVLMLFLLCGALWAQAPAKMPEEKPLQAIPYSPSLDLTDMDRTVDACTDFYKYSCGGWQKNNPIPADQGSWNVYAKLDTENEQFLWGILVDAAKPVPGRTAVQQKIGDYFAACMDEPAIDRIGEAPLKPVLAGINALTTRRQLIQAIATLQRDTMGAYFFNASSAQDEKDSNSEIAEVRAGGLGLPDRDYYVKTDVKSVEIRQRYVEYVTHLLVLTGESKAQAAADAADVMKIESALAKASLTRVDLRDPYKIYHKMTVEELAALAPAIDWNHYFAVQGIHGTKTLNVTEPEFFKALNQELTVEPLPALKAYMRFHAATGAATSLASPFETANFDFYEKYLRGIPQMQPRWKRCTRQVDSYLGEALGQEFVQRTFAVDTKAKVQLMTNLIEESMQDEIEHLDWMSDATKVEAIRKLHAIRNKIAYPETWRDYSALSITRDNYFGDVLGAEKFEAARQWAKVGKPVDRNEWQMTPPTVNAYFNPDMNDINFPAGVLQPPLYDTKMDDAPNYGNTGSTIGHELTHGFDDQGRLFDGQGDLKDWWTKDDAKGFEDHINCLRDQFATFTEVDDIKINSKLTSGEDVADLGGTLLGYLAWKKATANEDLQPVDGFTPDQRYFIGMAQWACENQRPEELRVQAATDPHSPGWARINGIVSNMPEFVHAFGCKAGQPMVHIPACRVW